MPFSEVARLSDSGRSRPSSASLSSRVGIAALEVTATARPSARTSSATARKCDSISARSLPLPALAFAAPARTLCSGKERLRRIRPGRNIGIAVPRRVQQLGDRSRESAVVVRRQSIGAVGGAFGDSARIHARRRRHAAGRQSRRDASRGCDTLVAVEKITGIPAPLFPFMPRWPPPLHPDCRSRIL